MKLLFRLIVASVILIGIAGYVYFSDGDRYKLDLEAYLTETSGYQISINGDINWQIQPTLGLSAENIDAIDASENINIGKLTLNAQIGNLFAALESWQIHSFVLENVKVESQGSQMILRKLDISDFRPNEASPFVLDLGYVAASADASSEDLNLAGQLTFTALDSADSAQRARVRFTDTTLTSTYASGICNGEITDNNTTSNTTSSDDDLLPVDSILAFDADFSCDLSRIVTDQYEFKSGQLNLNQSAGKSKVSLSIADFFGGKFQTATSIDVNASPITWDISFSGADIDSRKLLALTDSKLNWQAPLKVQGQLKLLGNTERALAKSVMGSANLDGGQGSIDIGQVKNALILINQLASTGEPVEALPDQLQYNNLTAAWTIQGEANTLIVDLDNLQANASGSIAFLDDNLSLTGEAVVQTPKAGQQIKLTPVLMDAAIPFDCKGKLAEPECKPNTEAVGKMLLQILKNSQQDKVKEKLDEVIEEKVPEQLREAAKQLLNLFGQ
ncbi:hypothetical protein N9F31_01135 [Pseudomonadales bacterium]|nr:hypothetical protein [Pseudomonadales bacterium]